MFVVLLGIGASMIYRANSNDFVSGGESSSGNEVSGIRIKYGIHLIHYSLHGYHAMRCLFYASGVANPSAGDRSPPAGRGGIVGLHAILHEKEVR